MVRSKKSSYGLSILVLFVVGSLLALGIFLYFRSKKKIVASDGEIEDEPHDDSRDEEPNENALLNFYVEAKKVVKDHYGIDDNVRATLLTSQAAFETGNFVSQVYLSNNNAFGMKQPKVRPTTSIGEKGRYANYPTVYDSILDRLLWDDYNKVEYPGDTTVKSFTQRLNKLAYFEAPYLEYQNGVNAYCKKLQTLISQG